MSYSGVCKFCGKRSPRESWTDHGCKICGEVQVEFKKLREFVASMTTERLIRMSPGQLRMANEFLVNGIPYKKKIKFSRNEVYDRCLMILARGPAKTIQIARIIFGPQLMAGPDNPKYMTVFNALNRMRSKGLVARDGMTWRLSVTEKKDAEDQDQHDREEFEDLRGEEESAREALDLLIESLH